jgi:hypothetical protein
LQQHRFEVFVSRIQYLPSVLLYLSYDVLLDPCTIAYRSRPHLHGIGPPTSHGIEYIRTPVLALF